MRDRPLLRTAPRTLLIMDALPAELLLLVLERLSTTGLLRATGVSKRISAVANNVLLLRAVTENTNLTRLYSMTRPLHASTRETVAALVSQLPRVIGNTPKLKSKTENKKYHATDAECAHIGLTDTVRISKHYYRYILISRALRRSIARLYRFVNLSWTQFPFLHSELDRPCSFIAVNHPVETTPPVELQITHVQPTVPLAPRKRKRLESSNAEMGQVRVEFSFKSCKIIHKDKHMFAEWLPQRITR